MVIDSDAHVIESARTWDYLEPSEKKYAPIILDTPTQEIWLIGDKVRPRLSSLSDEQLAELSRKSGRNMVTSRESREMGDVELRLRHMDETGTDVQVLYTTMFIRHITDQPRVEVALCRSYNRWMADIWKMGHGRLRWVCVPPFLSMPDALDEVRYAKEHGAVGVLLRPHEGPRLMTDPYFYPVLEEAQRLDLPIASHVANADRLLCESILSHYPAEDPLGASFFAIFNGPAVLACHALLSSPIPELFPTLRWGFIEAGCQWLPWILGDVNGRGWRTGQDPVPQDTLLSQKRVYVTCENHEDLPYVVKSAGADTLLIGTDYGHADPAADVDALGIFTARPDLDQDVKRKITDDNARAFYGL